VPPIASTISISAARWLLGVISAVVLAFLIVTAVTQHIESSISVRTQDIVSHVMPSVQLLTRALATIDRLEYDLEQFAAVPADRRSGFRDQIAADRRDIDHELTAYAQLPRYPNEPGLLAAMEADRRDLADLLDAASTNGSPTLLASVYQKLDAFELSIQRVVEFDAAQGQRLGREIDGIRTTTRILVVWLDSLTVALAIAAAVLALRHLRRARRTLELARRAGEQREADLSSLAEALGNFAGQVAHDIVSPLSTALLSLERVRQACQGDAAVSRAADRGIAAIHRVHNLVEGLLAFSRAGGRPEPGSSTEIAPVIAEVIDELGPLAKQQRIALNAVTSSGATVACSAAVLTSLVSNLVRNAIKYMGDSAERCIDVRVLDAGNRFRIEVQDTGPGIPSEQQKSIFEPYVQLGRGGTGIGLGLATVERLARAHGGAVGVTSSPGRGSLFWFELPALNIAPDAARDQVALRHT
jgi:signal transduction histidine kinase